jgi:FlaA1/EpsC-like NDP-sugar epimerase
MKNIGNLKYFKKIRAAYEGRPCAYKTDIFSLSVVIAVIVFIFITFSVFLHPGGTHFSYNFTSEQGSITILSATTLTTACLLAYTCFFIKSPISKRQKIFFLLAALALTYLAIDEVAQFHENGGLALDHIRKFRKMIRWSGIRS